MALIDKKYQVLLLEILGSGYTYEDRRRDVTCIQVPTHEIRVPLKYNCRTGVCEDFPLLTTKKIYFNSIIVELLWFLRGDSNIKYLLDHNVNIWNDDAYHYYLKIMKEKDTYNHNIVDFEEFIKRTKDSTTIELSQDETYTFGDVGHNYGHNWRNFDGVDQVNNLIEGLMKNPMSRRHIVTAWNPATLQDTALPPCHWSWEIIPEPISINDRVKMFNSNLGEDNPYRIDEKLSVESKKELLRKYLVPEYAFTLKWNQRSVDTFLGLPFNIASYATLACIIGSIANMVPKEVIGSLSNVHIYTPHLEQIREQLKRNTDKYESCSLRIKNVGMELLIDYLVCNLNPKDFIIENYQHYPALKANMIGQKK